MKKIAIIGAMELEVAELKEAMEVERKVEKASMVFFEGTLKGVPVVIVQCGVGKVNASLCVQILADMFEVTHVINTGVAGSLNAALDIGDILVSKDAIHHDMDVTKLGYEPGQVPGIDTLAFPADADMAEKAVATCQEVNPDIHCKIGRVVSGDQFISDKDTKTRLIETFHGDCAEMEGASIAHGAYLNGLPFLIIRAISDKADDSAEMDYPSFEKVAAKHSAALVEALVQRI